MKRFVYFCLMDIVSGSRNDIQDIARLVRKVWQPTYGHILSLEQSTYMLDTLYDTGTLSRQMDIGHRFLLLKDGQRLLGFAGFELDWQHHAGTTKLHKLYLDTEVQGKGWGKGLLDAAIAYVKEQGQTALVLNVNRENKAFRFYERYGFQVIAEEDIPIGNGYYMNDYVLKINW